MGMMSRAMKKRKKEMERELDDGTEVIARTKSVIAGSVDFSDELAMKLHEIASVRGTTVEALVVAKMTALCNQYENQKILRLIDMMPYGQYRGLTVEDMIRADPRYVNWLASTSDIFVLDEGATNLLAELS